MSQDDGYTLVDKKYLGALEELYEACDTTKAGGAFELPPQIAIVLEHLIKVSSKPKWSANPRRRITSLAAMILIEVKSQLQSEVYICPGGHRKDGQPYEPIEYDDVNLMRYDPNYEVGSFEFGKCGKPITITWEDESEDGYHKFSYPVATSEDYFMSDKEYEKAKEGDPFFQPGSCVRALGLDETESFWSNPWLDFYARGYAMNIIATAEYKSRLRLVGEKSS